MAPCRLPTKLWFNGMGIQQVADFGPWQDSLQSVRDKSADGGQETVVHSFAARPRHDRHHVGVQLEESDDESISWILDLLPAVAWRAARRGAACHCGLQATCG